MSDELLRWRAEFPILARKNYLISNSLGAMPRAVYGRMQDYADTWATKGVKAWADEWWDLQARVGDLIAPLIGAGPNEVSMHPNITVLQAIILSCFEGTQQDPRRRRIISEDQNFPSVLYILGRWAAAHQAELLLVKSDDGMTVDTEKMLDAISEETLVVSISHVLFKSAFIQDVKTIIDKAHRVGATVVVDAYQSVGIMPVNVKEFDVDFLVGGVLKWLCGGPGGAFLYANPARTKALKPNLTGWFAHQRPFNFEIGEMQYRDDASKFLNGTPSIPSLYAASEGPRVIQQVGVERIRAKSLHQTSLLIERAQQHGFSVRSPLKGELRGGTVTLAVPQGYEVARALIAQDILVDYREGAGIRLAPHFYNNDEELEAAITAMVEILQHKTYGRFGLQRKKVT